MSQDVISFDERRKERERAAEKTVTFVGEPFTENGVVARVCYSVTFRNATEHDIIESFKANGGGWLAWPCAEILTQ